MPSPPVFIAGATGYTGRHLVAECRRNGLPAIAHVRPDSAALAQWHARFEGMGATLDTTPWERDAMAAAMQRFRPAVVFAVLGTTRRRARRERGGKESYQTVDYGLTRLLLDAVIAAGSRPRFVYLSAIGAREGTRNSYLAIRGRFERELRASGLPWLIIRPSFITGADRDESRPLERITARAVTAVVGVLGAVGARRMRERYRAIDGAELARGMVRTTLGERGSGRVVHAEELRG